MNFIGVLKARTSTGVEVKGGELQDSLHVTNCCFAPPSQRVTSLYHPGMSAYAARFPNQVTAGPVLAVKQGVIGFSLD